ncbi:DUF4292 domain-containing protein [Desertivirga arenae]|uniref:DUF4292 domain-containing protein n=1 Tax=Desertivirga arenae TaxID=2810309 RepID=UPI001A96A94F|nr:DUF4292 domain-containing protein [Pedobacter sp. SYSU D00823]
MKKNILNKLAIGLALVVFTSCKAKKTLVPPTTSVPAVITKPAANNSDLIDSLKAKQPSFNTLAIKAKADLKINNNSNDVSMSIRIKNSETIWVSVTAIAGLEVARALITPDSIKIMNRLQNEYMRKPFSYIYQFTSRQIDFKAIQGLFTANAFPNTLTESASFTATASQVEVKGQLSELMYNMIFNNRRNMLQNQVTDNANGQKLSVTYDSFGVINNQELPQIVNINSVANNKTIAIALRYNSVSIDEPVDFPFNVPKRFTVKD